MFERTNQDIIMHDHFIFDKPDKNGIVVYAYHPDYGWGRSKGIYYSPGDNHTNIDVQLGIEDGLTVSGTIMDKDSKPIQNASIEYSTLDFPPKTFNVDKSGRYTIEKAMSGFFLVASASGYQSEKRLCSYPYMDLSPKKESFRLSTESERLDISGTVFDKSGNPMPLVTVEALLCEEKMRYPINVIQTKTDNQGNFIIKEAITGRQYQIFASIDKSPYYKKQINGVSAGTENLIVILDKPSHGLKITLDRQDTQNILKDEDFVFIDVLSNNYSSPKITKYCRVMDIPNEDPIIIQSDEYNTICAYWQSKNYDIYGQQQFSINNNSPDPYPITIKLHATPMKENVMIVGKMQIS